MTLQETIISFMEGKQGCTATLKQIYDAIKKSDYETSGKTVDCSARAIIYRHKETFKRIGKGLYVLQGEKSTSLLINGDSRKMEEIEDNSIDCIITDHPWSDKKAHKSGNQKGFAEYETFCYTQEDFNAKARVLKTGAFLCEFLPVESATNWEYLSSLKAMAKKAGFQYYASCIWRKAPEGTINNGRTTKGVEQILIFSKGNPRRLAPTGKPYMTKNMLSYEVNIPIKASEKKHQAEKPLALYKYLIENLTEEDEICLDQFGGACNMLQAAIETKRFSIVYELSKEFVQNAVERLKMAVLYDADEAPETTESEISEEPPTEVLTLTVIPAEDTEFQRKFIEKVRNSSRKDLLSEAEWASFIGADGKTINQIFEKVNRRGYERYNRPVFDVALSDYMQLQPIYQNIDTRFEAEYNEYRRPFYENVRIENQAYAEYQITQKRNGLSDYLDYVKKHFPLVNIARTEKILTEHCYV